MYGTCPRLCLRCARLVGWSPDGSNIVFMSNFDGNWEIYVMNAEGLGIRNVTNDPGYDSYPAWRPR